MKVPSFSISLSILVFSLNTPSISPKNSVCDSAIEVIKPRCGFTTSDKIAMSPALPAPASRTKYSLSLFACITDKGRPISLLKFPIVEEQLGNELLSKKVQVVLPLLPVIRIFFPLNSSQILVAI